MDMDHTGLLDALKAEGDSVSIGVRFGASAATDVGNIVWASQPGIVGRFAPDAIDGLKLAVARATGKKVVVCRADDPHPAFA